MAEFPPETEAGVGPDGAPPNATIQVAPSPHVSDTTLTTRRMMVEVLIGLAPAVAMAVVIFRWYAVVQVGLCVLACLAAEVVFCWMQRKPAAIDDCSAAVTGVILGLSLPWSVPWYIAVIGSGAAIGFGKAVFGGLGYNIFNPAMVGRAFVMLSFATHLGASAYVRPEAELKVVTRATPLTFAKQIAKSLAAGNISAGDASLQLESGEGTWQLLVGRVNGSLGETSALALLVGGIFLCVRRVASWQIPAGILAATLIAVELGHATDLTPLSPLKHLISGALLFGAFFIATDPVTSPLTGKGQFLFGLGIGLVVILIRLFSGYPEGVMFAVLVMNATVPLINRWTIPRPLGGPLQQPA